MHPTARRCVIWAVVLLVAGAVLHTTIPDLYAALVDAAGPNAEIGMRAVDVVLTLVRWALFPMGAALVGAAVVVQALAPPEESRRGPGDGLA